MGHADISTTMVYCTIRRSTPPHAAADRLGQLVVDEQDSAAMPDPISGSGRGLERSPPRGRPLLSSGRPDR